MFLKIGQFFPNFFLLKLSPSLFFLASNAPLFFWKLVNFWPLYSIFPPIFGPKNIFFFIKLSPGLFVLARNVLFFFFLKIGQFFARKLNFFQLSPSLFFWPEMSLFFLIMGQFLPFKLNFFDNFWPKKSFFFLLKLSPSLFVLAKNVPFFFFENWPIFCLKT